MTFAEAKELTAIKAGYPCWENLRHYLVWDNGHNSAYDLLYDEAAELYAASVREEATLKDAIKILNRIAPTATPKEYKYLSEAVAALD
jgi:hypothetical protein